MHIEKLTHAHTRARMSARAPALNAAAKKRYRSCEEQRHAPMRMTGPGNPAQVRLIRCPLVLPHSLCVRFGVGRCTRAHPAHRRERVGRSLGQDSWMIIPLTETGAHLPRRAGSGWQRRTVPAARRAARASLPATRHDTDSRTASQLDCTGGARTLAPRTHARALT